MTSAVIYCRISADFTGDQLGVERQEEACRRLCEQLGFEVADVIVDNDLSATKINVTRPGFERLLTSSPDAIVCWHTDRLVRVTRDLERVIELGVNVYAVEAGHLDLSNPAGRAVARTLTAWATYEGEQKAARQRLAHMQRAKAGKHWWTRRPFGYNKDGTLHPVEAPLLQDAYREVLAGRSINSIARSWKQQGVVSTVGKVMPTTSVRQLLVNPRNAGIRTYHGEEVGDGAWEPLIDKQTYRATMRLLSAPGRRNVDSTKRSGFLTGIARCEICEGKMGVSYQDRGQRRYSYYSCRQWHNSWPREWLDDHVSNMALAFAPIAQQASDGPEDEAALEAELQRLTTLQSELMEDRRAGLLSRAQWLEAHTATQEDIDKLTARLGSIAAPAKGPRLSVVSAEERRAQWKGMVEADKRQIVREVLGNVWLQPRGKGVRTCDPALVRFDGLSLPEVDWDTLAREIGAERGAQGLIVTGSLAQEL